MPAKRSRHGAGSSSGRAKQHAQEHSHSKAQTSKTASKVSDQAAAKFNDHKVFYFNKDEIVWAKMKFFSAWPAKVCSPHSLEVHDTASINCLSFKSTANGHWNSFDITQKGLGSCLQSAESLKSAPRAYWLFVELFKILADNYSRYDITRY